MKAKFIVMVSNIIFGMQNATVTIYYGLLSLVYHPFTWGFVLGILISTLIHLFFLMIRPQESPSLFQTLHLGKYLRKKNWYMNFGTDYLLLRVSFFVLLSILLIFIILIFVAFTPKM